MNKKYLAIAAVPVFAAALATAGIASAHGFGGFGGVSNQTPEQMATMQTQQFQREATLIGVSVDEVKAAWAAGKSLETLAAEHGITADQLKTKMDAERQAAQAARLQTLVSQGVITQAQADARLAYEKAHPRTGHGMRHGTAGTTSTTTQQ